MSSINTNAIDVNFPVPGVNNNSQGFRNNFAAIKTNIDTAGNEITELQNKVVLKSALANSVVNNDMANTLISNASTRSFRATTYNLGNALSGTVLVNASLGDVQYGNISGDISLQFGSWAPVGTEQKITLTLGFSNREATVTFPTEVIANDTFGLTLVENYQFTNNASIVTIPAYTDQVTYTLRTIDCGNTIYITPTNRNFKTTQIQTKIPPSTGVLGDLAGDVAVSPKISQVAVSETDSITANIYPAVVRMPTSSITGNTLTVGSLEEVVLLNGTISGNTLQLGNVYYGNILVGMLLTGNGVTANTYIVKNLANGTGNGSTWRLSETSTVSNANATMTNSIIDADDGTRWSQTGSITGTTMTLTGTPATGTVAAGQKVTGTGVTANTAIVSGSGTSWTISPSQTVGSTTLRGGNIGTTLTVGTLTGTIKIGMLLSGGNIVANTYINNNISGSGSGSKWQVSATQFQPSVTITGQPVIEGAAQISTGMILSGHANLTANTYYITQEVTPNTTYYINTTVTVPSSTIIGTTGITNTVMTVGTFDGEVADGMILSGTGVTSGTYIIGNLTAPGRLSQWEVSESQILATSQIDGIVNPITCVDTSELYTDLPVVFTGATFGGVTGGNTYYVNQVINETQFSISSNLGNTTAVTLSNASGTMYANPVSYLFVATDDYDANVITSTISQTFTNGNISCNNSASLSNNAPIIFSGEGIGGIETDIVYYIKSVNSGAGNITISKTRTNGVAGTMLLLSNATPNVSGAATSNTYIGKDIWRRLNLNAF